MSEDQNRNCPPGSIPGLPDPGPGGEEQIEEVEFPELNFPEFLSPIEEVDTSPFEGNSSIREINIIDEFHFLRSQVDLFTTNAEGEEVIEVPGFHDQRDSNAFKRSRIATSYKEAVGSDIISREMPVDTIRVENNYFWHLRGTERAPVEEEWGRNNLNESFIDPKYTLERLMGPFDAPTPASAFHKTNTDRYKVKLLSEQDRAAMNENFVAQLGIAMTTFEDFNTSVQQPLLASEAEVQGIREEILKNSYVVDFEPVINEPTVDLDSFLIPEFQIPGYYREYYRMVTENSEDCGIEDKIQKYICANLEDLDTANQSPTLLARNPNHIKITLKRPASSGNEERDSRLDQILNIFAETQIDKYYLETLTGYGDYYRRKRFIQIADEKSPTQQQFARINDRFTLNYLKAAKKRFERLISDISSDQEHHENVINKRQEYPLRFAAHNSLDDLIAREEIKVPEFENAWRTINLNNPLRTYSNIAAGQKAPSFIVGYRIEKYVANSESPVQVFYIMERPRDKNSPDVPPIEFLDSQVRYGKTYRYRIYSLVIVYGTEYSYANFSTAVEGGGSDLETQLKVDCNHMLRLMEVPFIERTVALTDLPPLPPEVSFVPYQGVSNKIRLIMNHAIGDKKEQPIRMIPGDPSVISAMRAAQPVTEDGSIRYYSDTVPQEYQIFSTTAVPTSYSSFSYNSSVITNGDISVVKDMDIQPNVDYYFTFRSAEQAGISNPSLVFKLRMVDTPNGIFMVLREYDIYSRQEAYTNLNFQRALQISPALIQKSIVYPEGTDLSSRDFALTAPSLEDISIGYPNNSIWGKRYKFRLTSKTSGKKLDLNIRFEQNELDNFLVPQFTPELCDPILREQNDEQEQPTRCIDQLPKLPTELRGFFPRTERFRHKGEPCDEEISLRFKGTEQTYSYEIDWNEPKQGMSFIEWLKEIPGVMKYCQCDENPDQLIDFIPPSVYQDFQKVEDLVRAEGTPGSNANFNLQADFDFKPIFGGDPSMQPKPRRFNHEIIHGGSGLETLRNEQEKWWYQPDDNDDYDRLETFYEQARDPDADIRPWKKRILRSSWFPHLETEPTEGTNLDPGDPGGFRYQEKQYKCLQVVKAAMGTFTRSHDLGRRVIGGSTTRRLTSLPVAEGVGIEFEEISIRGNRLTTVFEIPADHWPDGVARAYSDDRSRDRDSNFSLERDSCAEGFTWNGTECVCAEGTVRNPDNPCECIPEPGQPDPPELVCDDIKFNTTQTVTDNKSGEELTVEGEDFTIAAIANPVERTCKYRITVSERIKGYCADGVTTTAKSSLIEATLEVVYNEGDTGRDEDFKQKYLEFLSKFDEALDRARNPNPGDDDVIFNHAGLADKPNGINISLQQRKLVQMPGSGCPPVQTDNGDEKEGGDKSGLFDDGPELERRDDIPVNKCEQEGGTVIGGVCMMPKEEVSRERFKFTHQVSVTPFLEVDIIDIGQLQADNDQDDNNRGLGADDMEASRGTRYVTKIAIFPHDQYEPDRLNVDNFADATGNIGKLLLSDTVKEGMENIYNTAKEIVSIADSNNNVRLLMGQYKFPKFAGTNHPVAANNFIPITQFVHDPNPNNVPVTLSDFARDDGLDEDFRNQTRRLFSPFWSPNGVNTAVQDIIGKNITSHNNQRNYGFMLEFYSNQPETGQPVAGITKKGTIFYTSHKNELFDAYINPQRYASEERHFNEISVNAKSIITDGLPISGDLTELNEEAQAQLPQAAFQGFVSTIINGAFTAQVNGLQAFLPKYHKLNLTGITLVKQGEISAGTQHTNNNPLTDVVQFGAQGPSYLAEIEAEETPPGRPRAGGRARRR